MVRFSNLISPQPTTYEEVAGAHPRDRMNNLNVDMNVERILTERSSCRTRWCSKSLLLRKYGKAMRRWHGWHAFRRDLATNLHALGMDDKTIQAILRHSNVGLTMNVYVKSVNASQVNAMDALSEKRGICNDPLQRQRRG